MTTSPFPSEADLSCDPTQQYDTPSDVQLIEARWIAALETPSVPDYVTAGRTVRRRAVEDGRDMTQVDSDRLGFLLVAE
jgi:hypothetical protein